MQAVRVNKTIMKGKKPNNDVELFVGVHKNTVDNKCSMHDATWKNHASQEDIRKSLTTRK